MNKPHPSFAQNTGVSDRIKFEIKLLPDCRSHVLTYFTRRFSLDERKDEKRTYSKVMYDENLEKRHLSGKKHKLDDGDKHTEGNNIDEQLTLPKIMNESQACERILRALPDTKSSDITPKENQNDNYLVEPFGTVLQSYTVNLQGSDTEFVLALANGQEAKTFHSQIQKLALFFIENADCVDLTSDEGGGAWDVLYCFRKHENLRPVCSEIPCKSTGYSLVGYMTLFGFYAPFHKPKGGIVLRICQALVLPPYQRQGHGKRMMRAVYEHAGGKFDIALRKGKENSSAAARQLIAREIVLVNVEDPAPGFTYMRDAIDYECFQSLIADKEEFRSLLQSYLGDDYKSLPDADATTAASIAKITSVQIQIAYEIHKLSQMKQYSAQSLQGRLSQIEELKKKYRLMVKKRLNQLHKEEIGSCGTKMEKQAMLSVLFEESYTRYEHILKRGEK